MDWASFSEDAPSHACGDCGRSFAGPGPLNFHRRSCRTTKRRLQGVLVKAKALWEVRKRSKRHPLDEPQVGGSSTPDPPSHILGLPLTTAVLTTATPGSNAAAFVGAVTEIPPPPVVPTHAQVVLTQRDTVCRDEQADRID